MRFSTIQALSALSLCFLRVFAVTLDVELEDSICEAAWEVIVGELNYYEGTKYGGTVGMFSPPYYWWNAGEVFGGWVDYWAFCAQDNDTFTELLSNAMYHQAGDDFNYMPSNQSMTEGNDDQGVWAMAIIQAVERNFTNTGDHTWLYMTQAIFNTMKNRWDTTTCGGGLRWQIFTWNSGYNYKNSISNGCLFHLAARLYRFTGEKVYLETAEKVWNWMWDVGFMRDSPEFIIYDGADDTENCTDLTIHKWSYTYGVYLAGCAYLYNATGNETWETGVAQILDASSYFFNNSIMTETTCAQSNSCNNDQRSFRSLFARCLSLTAGLMPEHFDQIYNNWIVPSAKAAAGSCSGGSDHITCGENWSVDGWDGKYGLGEQISAGETIMALITSKNTPLTPKTGGSDSGANVDAGNSTLSTVNRNKITITGKDRAGAGVLTAIVLGVILAGSVWMLF
ncbi:putative 6-D-mannanase [Clavispora lusitaniae]|uniref:6-D-mannanase n=1 Tax=Clavispora lusitaniae TaxID=36911 RepID=A0ACD0WCZ6_CLALS|nr:putative 6-D-mannanase [Clavispora lusitaniae]QFZ31446.1 putative 6-D-mannanase [Clavispora lusitaniae]QFZ37114.1 putative 6-D-mannanase [Clavispora lusitaniae]QFZ42798.1 putative 6-D-mannanase [Clavispora lusitaniae]QFZ48474.1 putative 6-D-mannanase [Clavispora lusitaniae]